MIDHTKPPCSECHSYDNENHGLDCSKSNLTVEQKLEEWKRAYARQVESSERREQWYKNGIKKFEINATFWQGKYHIVKHENNVLRRKLEKINSGEYSGLT